MERPTIYVGSEANVWHAVLTWANNEVFDTIDGSDGMALEMALGATLFSETRNIHVTNAQAVKADWWERGIGAIRACGSIVSQDGTHTKQSKTLEKAATIVLCDRRWMVKTINEVFKSRKVTLEPAARQTIESRCEGDMSRVRSVATICEMAGINKLGASAAAQLLGSARNEAKVWEACDHLLDGRVQEAIDAAAQSEAVPLAANLTETVRTLLVLREGGTVAGMHPYVQKRRGAQAQHHDARALANALRTAAACEHMIRNGEIGASAAIARIHIDLRRLTRP